MKNLIYKTVMVSSLIILSLYAKAQKQDSSKRNQKSVSIGICDGKIFCHSKKDTLKKNDSTDNVNFFSGLTFTRLDIGFYKLLDNGSFALSPANKFLEYQSSKTRIVSFDILQLGYRFNSQYKVYLAAGFDWTLIRLRQNITMQKNMTSLTYIIEPIEFSKNRFSSSYLHIPVNFEYRTKKDKKGDCFHLVVGPEIAFLLNAKIKQISKERGKEKAYDDYNFAPFRFGGTLRMGYDGIGLFMKYNATDMFDSAPQKGVKSVAFGLTFGLN